MLSLKLKDLGYPHAAPLIRFVLYNVSNSLKLKT